MRTGLTILGSGSSGNATVIHCGDEAILVDAGFSRKEILERLGAAGISPSTIKAIIITHEHQDHVKGCRVLSDELDVPVYMTGDTCRYMQEYGFAGQKKKLFAPGSVFEIASFKVEPFTVQHDALQPVGFVIRKGALKIGIATDLGFMTTLVKHKLKACDALLLEANHDLEMLKNSKRPYAIKKRIMSRHGHLNNNDAISSFCELFAENTKQLFLVHISGECNDRNLLRDLAQNKLTELRRNDIFLSLPEQSAPTATAWLDMN